MPGTNTSLSEDTITNIERDGFWLLTDDGEFFVSFEDYPGFQHATVAQIHDFVSSGDHFHWPALDIDIELDALKHPERFPLKFQH
ncbi:MAG TPA: DUF2442 domain-containing protein [Anaerolineales bacterium]|nr:DUF2442 domain-containing protein [Anaerolineales bacterium]